MAACSVLNQTRIHHSPLIIKTHEESQHIKWMKIKMSPLIFIIQKSSQSSCGPWTAGGAVRPLLFTITSPSCINLRIDVFMGYSPAVCTNQHPHVCGDSSSPHLLLFQASSNLKVSPQQHHTSSFLLQTHDSDMQNIPYMLLRGPALGPGAWWGLASEDLVG